MPLPRRQTITKDSSSAQRNFRAQVTNLRAWNNNEAADKLAQGAAYGWTANYLQNGGFFADVYPQKATFQLAPWMEDMTCQYVSIRAARARVPGALQRLLFVKNFIAGRYANADKGFNPADGMRQRITVYQPDAVTPLKTWLDLQTYFKKLDVTGVDQLSNTWGPNFSNMAKTDADYGLRSLDTLIQMADALAELGQENSMPLAGISVFDAAPASAKVAMFMVPSEFAKNSNNNSVRIGTTRGTQPIKTARATPADSGPAYVPRCPARKSPSRLGRASRSARTLRSGPRSERLPTRARPRTAARSRTPCSSSKSGALPTSIWHAGLIMRWSRRRPAAST
jgi:hypothetical protein